MKYDLQTLRGDIFGGITAAVVGLPVALAFGVASGLGAIAGLYGGDCCGVLYGRFWWNTVLKYPVPLALWP